MIKTATGKKIHKVGVIIGGYSDETNFASSPWVVDGLLQLGLDVDVFDIRDLRLAAKLQKAKLDVIFPTSLGAYGEDGKLQGFFETALMDTPYVGSGVGASAIGMNKVLSKYIFKSLGFFVAEYIHIHPEERIYYKDAVTKLGLPIVIKPVLSGASLGLAIVRNENDFKKHLRKTTQQFGDILLERFLQSTEPFTEYAVGIIEDDKKLIALPVCQIKSDGVYDTEKKSNGSKHSIPAKISAKKSLLMQEIAKKIFTGIGCHSLVRVDMILAKDIKGKDTIYILEINTLPGLIPNLVFPKMCAAGNISYTRMLTMLLQSAYKKRRMEIPRRFIGMPKLPESFVRILPKLPKHVQLANFLIQSSYGR